MLGTWQLGKILLYPAMTGTFIHTHRHACMSACSVSLSLCMSLSLIRSLTTRAIIHADIPFHRGRGYYRARPDKRKSFCVCVCVCVCACVCVCGGLNCCTHVSSSPWEVFAVNVQQWISCFRPPASQDRGDFFLSVHFFKSGSFLFCFFIREQQ